MARQQKAMWQLAKPRLYETAARNMATRRHEVDTKNNKKIRQQLKLSAREHGTGLDALLNNMQDYAWTAIRLS